MVLEMSSEDKKVINKKEEQKLISDEKKNLKTFIDGVEYGVTNNGCIYYETLKGKQTIVCNFFMQLLEVNNDLSDRSYIFNVILQDGRDNKKIVLNNYNLKNSRWIDELGIEYHLGQYAKYKNLKIYISNLIVENMPILNKELIKDTISKIKDVKTIDTNKDYTLGKSFLLGISRLLETDNNTYIASSRESIIDMSDSSKLMGFRESHEDSDKEEYCLKMDKVIKKLKNFNDIFNEELKLKLNNNKIIYSQLAELGVLIVNKEKDNVSPTKLFHINGNPIRFFRLNIKMLTELVKKYTEDSEFLKGVDYTSISDEIVTTSYSILSPEQIKNILNELTTKIFKEKCTSDKIKYESGFNSGVINQNYDIDGKIIDDKVNELLYEIKKENNLNKINKEIDEFVNNLNTYIKNKYEHAGFLDGLNIYIKQEIAKKQIEEGRCNLENKDTDNNSSSSL
jgi:hypothetical protein